MALYNNIQAYFGATGWLLRIDNLLLEKNHFSVISGYTTALPIFQKGTEYKKLPGSAKKIW